MKKMTASQFKLDETTGIWYGDIADCLDINGVPETTISVTCVNYTGTYHIPVERQISDPPYQYAEIQISCNVGLPRQVLIFS